MASITAKQFTAYIEDEFDVEVLDLLIGVIEKRKQFIAKMQDIGNPRAVVKGYQMNKQDLKEFYNKGKLLSLMPKYMSKDTPDYNNNRRFIKDKVNKENPQNLEDFLMIVKLHMNNNDFMNYKKMATSTSIDEGAFNPQQFELLRRKISGRYGKRFDVTKSEQFITIDVGDFDINIVSDALHDMVFVEVDSDNPRKSKEYGMRDYDKIFKVIDTWLKAYGVININRVFEGAQIKKSTKRRKIMEAMSQPLGSEVVSMLHEIASNYKVKVPANKSWNSVANMVESVYLSIDKKDRASFIQDISKLKRYTNNGEIIL